MWSGIEHQALPIPYERFDCGTTLRIRLKWSSLWVSSENAYYDLVQLQQAAPGTALRRSNWNEDTIFEIPFEPDNTSFSN